jgi:hypothetical protein
MCATDTSSRLCRSNPSTSGPFSCTLILFWILTENSSTSLTVKNPSAHEPCDCKTMHATCNASWSTPSLPACQWTPIQVIIAALCPPRAAQARPGSRLWQRDRRGLQLVQGLSGHTCNSIMVWGDQPNNTVCIWYSQPCRLNQTGVSDRKHVAYVNRFRTTGALACGTGSINSCH